MRMSPESRFGTKRSPYSLSRSLMLFRRGLEDSGVVSEVVESTVERGSGGIGYAEGGMYFGTVPSMTVYILDILLSGAETLSERRVLETGHGWKGENGDGEGARGWVAYVVAVIGQEKAGSKVHVASSLLRLVVAKR